MLEGSDGADTDQPAYSQLLEAVDIGAVGNLTRQQFVTARHAAVETQPPVRQADPE